jgi:hypothetical protein
MVSVEYGNVALTCAGLGKCGQPVSRVSGGWQQGGSRVVASVAVSVAASVAAGSQEGGSRVADSGSSVAAGALYRFLLKGNGPFGFKHWYANTGSQHVDPMNPMNSYQNLPEPTRTHQKPPEPIRTL